MRNETESINDFLVRRLTQGKTNRKFSSLYQEWLDQQALHQRKETEHHEQGKS